MRLIALLSLTLLTGFASAPATIEQIGVRDSGEVHPPCEPGHENSLSGGSVTIRPGETICLTIQVQDSSVVPVAVVTTANPQNTLILQFRQRPGTSDMVLTVHNPLPTFFRYKAHMLLPGSAGYEYTSSCPVLSKRQGIEHWPHAITALRLSDFSSLPELGTMTCQ